MHTPRTPSPGGALTIDVITIDARLLDAARDAFESQRGSGTTSLHAAIRDALLEHLTGALDSVPPADLRAHATAGADAVMARLAGEHRGALRRGPVTASKGASS